MNSWQDEKIQNVAGRYIRKHAVDPEAWRYTFLLRCHPSVQQGLVLEAGELLVVTSYISESSWYALTTRRVLGWYNETEVEILATDIVDRQFGNFKGYRGAETEVMTLVSAGQKEAQLEYETRKASMAPIHYFGFWELKYPVLHKLKDRPRVAVPA